jgi:hypothetical protein
MNRIQGTINRIQDTKHRKTTEYKETTKHENKGKLLPVAQRYRISYPDPVSTSGIPKLRDRAQWSASCPGNLCLSGTNTVNKNNHNK